MIYRPSSNTKAFSDTIRDLGVSMSLVATLALAFMSCASLTAAQDATTAQLNYNRDIRPILADKCFPCHGPDASERQAELRLDSAQEAAATTDSGLQAIVPGSPEDSELVRRIFSTEDYEMMPPPNSGKSLTDRQKETLKKWIAEGAKYERHWSFIVPRRPTVPKLRDAGWCRNEIDFFALKRLREAGLSPSPEAERRTLIRRLSFDLTGLPPTLSEVNDFLADESPQAYDRLVDRLLASPRFGERMAVEWLDLARYADTDGYEKDSHRQMWPYRDWVINAFNSNMPFDEFTIQQLAGDMLPDATRSQKIATAFNRNGPTTSESGSDPAEYAVKYAVDRVSTTSTVWLGLTMQCAECHDHKFDPITAKDFYSFLAFFDQVPETPLYEGADSPPSIPALSAEQESKAAHFEQRLASAKRALESQQRTLAEMQSTWETARASAAIADQAALRQGLVAEYRFEDSADDKCNDSSGFGHDGHVTANEGQPTIAPQPVSGLMGKAYEFVGAGLIDCGPLRPVDLARGFSYGAWVKPTAHGGVVLSCTDPQQGGRGFDLYLQAGVAMVHITDSWPSAAIKLTTVTNYFPDQWIHVLVVCSGGQGPEAIRIYFNGARQPTKVDVAAGPLGTVANAAPLRIGSRANGESAIYGVIDDVRVYDRALSDHEVGQVAQEAIDVLVKLPAEQRTAEQTEAVNNFYRVSVVDVVTAKLRAEISEYQQQWDDVRKGAPMVRIMEDAPQRRPTYILLRGDYQSPGEQVQPAVPVSLGTLPADQPATRLTLARWLVRDQNPLTARVMVNRLWAMCFGIGIVRTVDDFGSQGEWPSHPELLDWLASTFTARGWDVKEMLRLIVTSSTYRQSSAWTKGAAETDPENRLLARGPRRRLPAEMVRDNALLVSGLLHEQFGGPSVFPYHPPGLWEEMAWAEAPHKTWIQDRGPNLYRRGLYTFWKRSLIHPAFSIFDAPTRNVCAFARPTTNTPLQSFVTLNETSFIEAARGVAGRTLFECDGEIAERIEHMYLLTLSRPPLVAESASLRSLYGKTLARFTADPAAAERFISVGDLSRLDGVEPAEYATWTVVAQVVLNLDETLAKE